jgi:YegS/Rv2252/BmrU family lipid kinase
LSVAVIINPISGTGGRLDVARRRAELASSLVHARGVAADIVLTERPDHASELATAAVARGVKTVIAWGGDGTVNAVGSVLAFGDCALGVIPSGSGNGLARELGIPLRPEAAFAVALDGAERLIDCGEVDRRLFFNIAGFGLDARVAHQFTAGGLVRRGFRRYLEITTRELLTFEPDDHTIVADDITLRQKTIVVAIANGRQYGNGAVIAPDARVDDGQLDVVVIAARHPIVALLQAPLIFARQIARVPGVTIVKAKNIEITSARPVLYHLDGEPYVGAASVKACIRPRALRVRVPQEEHKGRS